MLGVGLGTEDSTMPRKRKLAQPEPDTAVEKIKARLMQLRCAPEQVELHVSRLITIKNKPKVDHHVSLGGHSTKYVPNRNRQLKQKRAG
jgi:hypothetical protein